MVEISMSSDGPETSPAREVGYQNEREGVIESMSSSDNMTHSYGDLRQSGEWTVVTCQCCGSPSSLSDEPGSLSDEKLLCTCNSIPADCSSNGSSSDVAVINESDVDELHQNDDFDIDGNARINNLALLSDKSHFYNLYEPIKTVDEKKVDTAETSSKNSILRLRLKNLPSSSLSSVESTNDGLSSLSENRRPYKKPIKKSKRTKISDESVITLERTITFLFCLILITCIMAFSFLVFCFFARYFDQVETSPAEKNLLFTDVDELEKEFTKCFDPKEKGQGCKLNLKLWKKSLVDVLIDENERLSKLIQKLNQVDENTESTNANVGKDNKSADENSEMEMEEKSPDVNPGPNVETVKEKKLFEEASQIDAMENSLKINPDLISEWKNYYTVFDSISTDLNDRLSELYKLRQVDKNVLGHDPYTEKYHEVLRLLEARKAHMKTRPEHPFDSWLEAQSSHFKRKNEESKVPFETKEKNSDISPDLSEFLKKSEPNNSLKTFINIPEYDADSTSKNYLKDEIMRQNQKIHNHVRRIYSDIEDDSDDEIRVDDEYEDIESDDGTETDQDEAKTIESLKKEMERLRNMYDLERNENEKLKKVFENQKQAEPSKETDEEEIEESDNFFSLFPDTLWKRVKNTANNLNPHLEKFRKKVAKVIKNKISGAQELSDSIRKKLEKNAKKLAKRLKKMHKAWNEDVCDEESTDCDENHMKNTDNVEDTLNELNTKSNWYTKRFDTIEEFQDDIREDTAENWVFQRAKGREEMHDTPKNNKKQKKGKNDDVKKKKKGKQY